MPMQYKKPEKNVAVEPTKWDTFKLVKKGDYRHQKGSARSECLALASNGMLLGTWFKKCAEIGYSWRFAHNCLDKLLTTKNPAWVPSDTNAEGHTWDEVKRSRTREAIEKKREKKAKKEAKKSKGKAKEAAPRKNKNKSGNRGGLGDAPGIDKPLKTGEEAEA